MRGHSVSSRDWVRVAAAMASALAIVVAGASSVSAQGKSKAAGTKTAGAEIMLMQPSATGATSGENQFEVMVKGSDGKPIADAEVSVLLVMPKTASMAEMRNEVKLNSAGNGTYKGTGNVMMAGKWRTTVIVMRNGEEIGRKKVTLTAK